MHCVRKQNISRAAARVFGSRTGTLSLAAFIVLFILSVSPNRVFAQGGPPMITDDTETVEKGHFEINTAFTIERGEDGTLFGTPLVDFNYGLNKRMQLKIEVPWLILHPHEGRNVSGIGNTNIGVRWRFRDETENRRIALSIYPAFEFNNGNSSVRRGLVEHGPEFLLPLEWQTEVGKFGINGDVGYRFKRGKDELIYGVVVGRDLKKIELLGEIHGTGPTTLLRESEIVFNLGSRVPLTKHTVLLLSAGRSLRAHFDPKFIGYAGLQVNF